MRLPFLQVTQETWTRAKMLGALLGVDRHRGFTLILDLWHWAVDLGPNDQSPTGRIDSTRAPELIAGALEWAGNTDTLVTALIDVGLVERTETGLRVRGLDRYKRTWEKNQRRRPTVPVTGVDGAGNRQKPARMVPVTGDMGAGTGAKPARQTQTQTQKEDVEALSVSTDPPAHCVENVSAHALASQAQSVSGPTASDLQALWNSTAHPSLPRWRDMTEGRKRKAGARLRERALDGPEGWGEVIRRISTSAFCLGADGGWRASPDWLLQSDTATKVLEGKYDRGKSSSPPRPPDERTAALLEAIRAKQQADGGVQ